MDFFCADSCLARRGVTSELKNSMVCYFQAVLPIDSFATRRLCP